MSDTTNPYASSDQLSILDYLVEGCQVISRDWKYVYLNKAAALHGKTTREQLLGRTMMEAYPGIERTPLFDELSRCMKERVAHELENEFIYPDGSKGWFELRIEPVPLGIFILSLDITHRRKAEEELRESRERLHASQRLESIGRLAGGIAHDFNNLLSVVLSYAGFALKGLKNDDPIRADIQEIIDAANRAAELTRQLLAFGRKQVLQPEVLNFNPILRDMERMLRRVLGEDVELRLVLAEGLGNVRVDPSQIEQVVMNLVVNARDAMPNGGKLTIETSNVELDDQYTQQHVATSPGPYVVLIVSDTGTGMDEQTRSRVFEPFFTTKDPSKGTGLGLSTVFGIVKQSGGNVWVYSELGFGTTFKIYFRREFSEAETAPSPPTGKDAKVGGAETVLVVEDEDAVRAAAKRILEAAGYQVLCAANGQEALRLSDRDSPTIHLMLTDVVMPGMSGRELADRIRTLHPELRVVYMSGYTDDAISHHGVLDQKAQFVEKPFTAAELTTSVRNALDEVRRRSESERNED